MAHLPLGLIHKRGFVSPKPCLCRSTLASFLTGDCLSNWGCFKLGGVLEPRKEGRPLQPKHEPQRGKVAKVTSHFKLSPETTATRLSMLSTKCRATSCAGAKILVSTRCPEAPRTSTLALGFAPPAVSTAGELCPIHVSSLAQVEYCLHCYNCQHMQRSIHPNLGSGHCMRSGPKDALSGLASGLGALVTSGPSFARSPPKGGWQATKHAPHVVDIS